MGNTDKIGSQNKRLTIRATLTVVGATGNMKARGQIYSQVQGSYSSRSRQRSYSELQSHMLGLN